MRIAVIFLYLFFSFQSSADSGVWAEQRSTASENSESRNSDKEFSGWLLITSDRDWKEKWDTPSEVIPRFVETNRVGLGENLTILAFYINPEADEDNQIYITCDVKIIRPDDRISYEEDGLTCADGELVGDPKNTRLAYAVIDFSAELGDPYGIWAVEVMLRDNNGPAEVFLQDHFELVDQSTLTRMQLIQVRLAGGGLK